MEIDAFILIGGRSRRLGQDKALLKLDGETLVKRAAITLRAGFSVTKMSMVAAEPVQFSHRLFPQDLQEIVYDIYPGKGAVGALHAALANTTAEWIGVLACDLPFVSPALLRHLTTDIRSDVDAVIPVQPEGRLQPLCGLYRVGPCLEYLSSILKANGEIPALAAAAVDLRTRLVLFDEVKDLPGAEHFFLNINAPDDLVKAGQIIASAV